VATVSFLLALTGLSVLASSMAFHFRSIFRREATPVLETLGRCSGAMLLALSLVASCEYWGVPVGIVAWIGQLTVGSWAVTLVLSLRARSVRGPAPR